MFKPILIIPFYNHLSAFRELAPRLASCDVPCLVIDDGSDSSQSAGIQDICQQYQFSYHRLPKNGGKGQAVRYGLNQTYQDGYTHALQIDADGQHNDADIPVFLQKARQNPTVLISGVPRYDASVPKARLYGRKITDFWVRLETGSRVIPDSMCGFRIYPLQSVCTVLPTVRANRMGFDIEILVRCFWAGIPFETIETSVHYPIDGVSHFHGFKDNLQISWVHTRLFCRSLVNRLFFFRRKSCPPSPK